MINAVGLRTGNELLQVAIQVSDDLGAHGVGTLAHDFQGFWQGGKAWLPRLQPAFGVAVQGRTEAGVG